MNVDTNYFWVRVFDYVHERDQHDKGILLDEFYLKDMTREQAKEAVRERYAGNTADKLRFAKPKKANGVYVVLMDSDRFYYERFYLTIDTRCFLCHKPIGGMEREFPYEYISEKTMPKSEAIIGEDIVYFCRYDHKKSFLRETREPEGEGVWQVKEAGQHGDVFGYIYLIYNRLENTYYIGQTRFMPFFRWQEHIKSGEKGDIEDLTFNVLATVRKNNFLTEEGNQKHLNSAEAWWIAKYQHEGHKVMNISKPRITVDSLRQRFNDMVAKEPEQVALELA